MVLTYVEIYIDDVQDSVMCRMYSMCVKKRGVKDRYLVKEQLAA